MWTTERRSIDRRDFLSLAACVAALAVAPSRILALSASDRFDRSKRYGMAVRWQQDPPDWDSPELLLEVARHLHGGARLSLPQGTRYEIRGHCGGRGTERGMAWYSNPIEFDAIIDWENMTEITTIGTAYDLEGGYYRFGRFTVAADA